MSTNDNDEVTETNFPAPADFGDKPAAVAADVPAATLPAIDASETKKYFDTLDEQRQKLIIRMAQNEKFKIKVVRDITKPKPEQEHVPTEFKYYEVTVKEWTEIELKRADLNDAIEYAAKKLITSGMPKAEEWHLRKKIAENHVTLYRMCAKAYLGMSDEQFDKSDWDDTRNAVDACNHRTVYSLPNLAKTSVSFIS